MGAILTVGAILQLTSNNKIQSLEKQVTNKCSYKFFSQNRGSKTKRVIIELMRIKPDVINDIIDIFLALFEQRE